MSKDDFHFKTMRHIEAVRNILTVCAIDLLDRGAKHDQSKLNDPEAGYYEKYTPLFKGVEYNSPEYKEIVEKMRPAVEHHNAHNSHHPEFFTKNEEAPGEAILEMTLFDLIEMLCDWGASGARNFNSSMFKSLEIAKKRFNIPEPLVRILDRTIRYMERTPVDHKANES